LSKRRMRRLGVLLTVLALAIGAIVGAVLMNGGSSSAAPAGGFDELSPVMAQKLAAAKKAAPPGSFQEGDRAEAGDEWLKHATPGDTIPNSAILASSNDWDSLNDRDAFGDGRWRPLGPTWAKGLPNPFRDRGVYNGGTPDFSGRIAHTVIDPNCGSRGSHDDDDDDGDSRQGGCRLWIANANGGVWRTNNALGKRPEWKYLSEGFEHNNIGGLELDPNDRNSNTLWAGTGEGNACASGCEAGVGVYKSRNGGESWSGPYGFESFYNRAVASIEVKPGNSNVIFAASTRAVRGISNVCCRGTDALIPGAPHFGLFRSVDGGRNWQLVNQGAEVLCQGTHPDINSQNQTLCSPRGARRVRIDPVDPNTVYASFFARGIWRSRQNGEIGSWEQIMPRIGPATVDAERAEFDLVRLPNGETRMYVGVGGGGVFARFRRNDNVRSAPALAVAASWIDLTSNVQDTPAYSSFGYCDGQCSYDNYVFAPATHAPNSGADHDTVYLSGDNEYNENNWGPLSPYCCPENPATGRSNGRSVLLTTNGGAAPGTQYFTDMTDDDTHDRYPFELHPDHHALTVNPRNYRQFFDVGDGGIVRSSGTFVDDSADCVQPKGYQGTRLAFCQLVLSRVPEQLTSLNKGLRTLHFYQLDYNPFDPDEIIGGTQDNGSWERGDAQDSGHNAENLPRDYAVDRFPTAAECLGRNRGNDDDGDGGGGNGGSRGEQIWVNTNIADGGHNNYDIGDPCFRQSSFQSGQLMVAYEPKNQVDMNWIADTLFVFYGSEGAPFIGPATNDPVHPHWLWAAREHVFRSTNQGRNPVLTKQTHREHCNIWYGDADVDDNGVYEPTKDICDDWKPLGPPGPEGRLTSTTYGPDRILPPVPMAQQRHVAAVERAEGDSGTVWAATNAGRVFVSKNADNPVPSAVVFDRIDSDVTAQNSPPRYPTGIYVDPKDSNHAWITYSGFNAKTPTTPGHVFEVRYVPEASTFRMLDGNQPRDRMGDIPATSITRTDNGRLYVGTDYGCVTSKGDGHWQQCAKGLPHMLVADLMYVRERKKLYAATHGQGIWELKVKGGEGDDNDDD